MFRFAGLAAIVATTVSATIGVLSLALAGQAGVGVPGRHLGDLVAGRPRRARSSSPRRWCSGTAIRSLDIPPERAVETILTPALVLAVGVLCFAAPVASTYPIMFLCVPPLAWVAFRFGPRATATHVALLSLIAVYTTAHGVGPFVLASRNESLLVLQAFMATIAMMMLPIAALVGRIPPRERAARPGPTRTSGARAPRPRPPSAPRTSSSRC